MNSEKAIKEIKSSTVQEAIESKSPIIANIALVHPGAAKKVLTFLIADVIEFLNVGKNMNAAQIIQTAELIINDPETKNLKPDDFKICFQKAKSGVYGRVFDRVDGQIIFEWLRAYMAERMDLAENMNLKVHDDHKKEPGEVNPEGQKKVLEILKSVVETEKPVLQERRTREKSPRDQYIQECFRKFDDLYSKNPVYSKQGQYIEWEVTRLINDKPETFITNVDQVEYTTEMLRRYDLNNKL